MNKKKVLSYIVIVYSISYLFAAIFFLSPFGKHPIFLSLFMLFYMLMPLIAAIIVQKLIYKEAFFRPLLLAGKPNLWWLTAMIFPLLLVVLTVFVALIFPTTSLDLSLTEYISMLDDMSSAAMEDLFNILPFHPLWLLVIQAFVAGITINTIFALGEEIGWRGFLLKELNTLGFWKASFLIGLIWGPWHAPLTIFAGHNYPSTPFLGILFMTVFCMLLSPVIAFVTIKSRSVISAGFFHGVINGSASLGIIVIAGGNPELVNGLTGLAGFIVLLLVNGILFVLTRGTIDPEYQNLFAKRI